MRPPDDTARREGALAALASRQHGIVARCQLRALGFTDAAIARRVRAGRLHRVHPGVYAVGHTCLTAEGRYLAAVLACGPGAVLSHHSAASLWDIRASATARLDVTVPHGSGRRSSRAIRVHRTRRPPTAATTARARPPAEVTVHRGIPVTTVARTLADLADTLRDRALEKAVERAVGAGMLDAREVAAIARDSPGRRGPARLARLLRDHDAEGTLTRSELEDALLELCDEYGIRRPLTNMRIAGHETDFAWPEARLIVEADSWRHHRSRRAFEADRARDAEHMALGWRVLRLTHARVTGDRDAVAAQLVRLGAPAVTRGASAPREPRRVRVPRRG